MNPQARHGTSDRRRTFTRKSALSGPDLPQLPEQNRQGRATTAVLARPTRSARSAAYEALASLGLADARMMLSAADCAALEGLAAEWLACGVTRPQFTVALTAGLPETVHSAGALAHKRPIAKMPPAPIRTSADTSERQPAPIRIMECTDCLPSRSPATTCYQVARGSTAHTLMA
ncbi:MULTISPECIES: hypothetical protein [unclassified Kitasatospora]|uniref:hypothetical protein n=1 Tax=unclassified Kitasatospora TaxID=2633591 RepID=UPI0007092A2C|nr:MULTISPECIES: hypothetical protein [unclassified Kitasatospora]KQV17341.1 hypothetical protein ASC99_25855 [Kitasatospora sp. Root107]